MPALVWSSDYELGLAPMDETHREFVDLVNRITEAGDAGLLAGLDELILHTVEHFAQEDRWMRESGFPPVHCHQTEHERVLEVDARRATPRRGRRPGARAQPAGRAAGLVRQPCRDHGCRARLACADHRLPGDRGAPFPPWRPKSSHRRLRLRGSRRPGRLRLSFHGVRDRLPSAGHRPTVATPVPERTFERR